MKRNPPMLVLGNPPKRRGLFHYPKGSQAARDYMARIRAMRGRKRRNPDALPAPAPAPAPVAAPAAKNPRLPRYGEFRPPQANSIWLTFKNDCRRSKAFKGWRSLGDRERGRGKSRCSW